MFPHLVANIFYNHYIYELDVLTNTKKLQSNSANYLCFNLIPKFSSAWPACKGTSIHKICLRNSMHAIIEEIWRIVSVFKMFKKG